MYISYTLIKYSWLIYFCCCLESANYTETNYLCKSYLAINASLILKAITDRVQDLIEV